MTTSAICKCGKNAWKVSYGQDKTIFFTCSSCGYNFNLKRPTAMEILENNKEAVDEYVKKTVDKILLEKGT
jgi:transposase-like protein